MPRQRKINEGPLVRFALRSLSLPVARAENAWARPAGGMAGTLMDEIESSRPTMRSRTKDRTPVLEGCSSALADARRSSDRRRRTSGRRCKAEGLKIHPARYPRALPEFFIKMLTEEGDVVLDPFAGSNTTGAVAESLQRRWIAFESVEEYLRGSKFRFKA
jgi:DNA modification methylase